VIKLLNDIVYNSAKLSDLVYLEGRQLDIALKINDFYNFNFFKKNNLFFILVEEDDKLYISIRGSNDKQDWLTNFNVKKELYDDVYFHAGFLKEAMMIHNVLINQNLQDKNIIFTGHSLGGALAAITAYLQQKKYKNVEKVITFGQPRFTNQKGAKKVNKVLKKYIRYINNIDIVPDMPLLQLGYRHAGKEVYITEKGKIKNNFPKFFKTIDKAKSYLDFDNNKEFVKDHMMDNYCERLGIF